MNKEVVIAFFLIFVNGCGIASDSIKPECVTDNDCAPAGCSSQLCVSAKEAEDIITTCEFKEEYKCVEFTSCGCVSNKCQWVDTQEYNDCLQRVGYWGNCS